MFKNRVFFQFFSTYILIIAIPFVLGTLINRAVVYEFEKHIKESHLAFLHQTRDIIERYTKEIEWSVFQIAGNTKLSRLLSASREHEIVSGYLFKEIVDDFNSYLLYTSSFNTTFYIYCRDAELILTPHSAYRYTDFINGKDFFQAEGISTKDWHEQLYSRYYNGVFFPARSITIEDFRNREMISYIQSLPIAYAKDLNEVDSVVVYLIGEIEFTSLLKNIDIPPGGWVYIADENNQIITGISNREGSFSPFDLPPDQTEGLQIVSFENKDMYIIYTKSKAGWKYVAVLPSDWVLKEIYSLQRISLISLFLSILLCISIASLIAYKRAGPLKKMIGLLTDSFSSETKNRISYKSLNSSISRLIDNNLTMQQQLHKQLDFVQAAFLNRLLHGYFRNQKGLELFLSYLGISVEENRFIVLIISLSGYEQLASVDIIDELNKTKVVLKNSIQLAFLERVFIYDLEEDQLALLVMSRQKSDGECVQMIKKSLSQLLSTAGEFIKSPICVGLGNIYHNLLEINHSFEEAKEALNFRIKDNKNQVIWFCDIEQELQEYYYPIDVEIRLISATKAGDREHILSIFDILEKENYDKRKLLPEEVKHLYFELQSTILKIRNQLTSYIKPVKVKEEIKEPSDFRISNLVNQYLDICENINEHKKSHNTKLVKGITEYLEKHYTNPNLCLYSVASHFSITESYLSFFFKEQTGVNFSWQLEKLRIDNAVELLKTINLSINEITKEVGYHSDKTFRRVFRRVKGSSPSEYRQDYLLNKLV